MSTSPQRISLGQSIAMVWRTLRSMRTALILLLLLALASVAGSLIPQWPNTPDRVLAYRADHPFWGSFFERAGLFDVYGSWWFVLITTLLFVSLMACLIPRTRAVVRTLRQRPVQAREIDAFRHYEERMVAAEPGAAIEGSARVLRRRLYRVAPDGGRSALAAEKGMLRETGSLLFHWAFILILVGVIYGKGTGFAGRAVVVEGTTWVDAPANYDGQIRTGRFFDGDFTGIGIRLREFESAFRETGQPMDFVSRVDLLDRRGDPIGPEEIRVNDPAQIEGLNVYQFGFGWAPVVEVRRGGDLVASDPVVLVQEEAPEGVPQLAMPWYGFVKLPSLRPQAAIELVLWPDSRAFFAQTDEPVAMLTENHPVISFTVWRGRLTDTSLRTFDPTLMRETATGIVGAGRTSDLETGLLLDPLDRGSGFSISFPELRQYSVLQVSKDAGVPLVLLAAILILVGLLPALYTSRRKLWVRAEPDETGTVLKVGGFALQRKPQFEEEFSHLVNAMTEASGGGVPQPASEGEKVASR